MFSDRRATFRADDTVEREANIVRRWAGVSNYSQFNIVDLIKGPLKKNLTFKMDIDFSDQRLLNSEAFVTFARGSDHAFLHVRRSVWNLAAAGHDRSRFILAHEIGHLKMHRHDALGFSAINQSILNDIPEEDRAEPQADKFADRLLVDEAMLTGFHSADEIAYYFNVPIECAQRRFDLIKDKARRRRSHQSGELCPLCLNFALVRDAFQTRCDTCGSVSACS